MAKEPTDSEDQVLATMEEFQGWFRAHKNPRKDPWKDPKPAE